ncbi:hypothetical protein H920_00379 [Fukomys damarensis]|uniref:Uncharacterized protein n=1 Tax=Fukomys damarensis TaxID=885580 RepID=A0A091ER93_FUKDA|nr:hypothetical protein H920_00379 [Fukomys damarensis]
MLPASFHSVTCCALSLTAKAVTGSSMAGGSESSTISRAVPAVSPLVCVPHTLPYGHNCRLCFPQFLIASPADFCNQTQPFSGKLEPDYDPEACLSSPVLGSEYDLCFPQENG